MNIDDEWNRTFKKRFTIEEIHAFYDRFNSQLIDIRKEYKSYAGIRAGLDMARREFTLAILDLLFKCVDVDIDGDGDDDHE